MGRPAVTVPDEQGDKVGAHHWLVYQFTGRAHGPVTPEDLATMRSVIGTFEVVAAGA